MQFENFNDVILGYELEHKIKKWKRESAKRSSIRKHKMRKSGVSYVA